MTTTTNYNSDWSKETKKFLRSKQWKIVRDLTFEHFDKVCTNCNSTDKIHLDHIKPRVQDARGLHWLDITNLQPLCEKCNCEVKGILDTDYRSHIHKEKCRELKPLFEQTLVDRGFDKTWTLWVDKNGDKLLSKKKKRRIVKRNQMKSQNAAVATKKVALKQQPKKEKKKKNKTVRNLALKNRKIKALDSLHFERYNQSKEELISAIEYIAQIT